MTADKKVYVGLPFILLFTGFVIAHMLELVLVQGNIVDAMSGARVTQLLLGIFGLFAGYVMVDGAGLKATAQEEAQESSKKLSAGIGLFVVMTVSMRTMAGFSIVQSQLRSESWILVLAAAPFEEAFFRLLIATVVFRAFLVIIPSIRYYMSIALKPILGIMMPSLRSIRMTNAKDNINKGLAIFITCIVVAMLFPIFHGGVADLSNPAVYMFYFVNSFAYTLVYLVTGSIMASTTAHLLHNGAVIFL